MSQLLLTVKQYKWFFLGGLLLLLLVIVFIIILLNSAAQPGGNGEQGQSPTNSPTAPIAQQPFSVISTSPENGATNVYAGELAITITTNNPIISADQLTLSLTPAIQYPLSYQNPFPTQALHLVVPGGLQTNTTYQATVKNQPGQEIYSWSFTTGSTRGQSQSVLREQEDQQINDTYYPLIKYLPYQTNEYLLGYADHLTLKITLKQPGLDQQQILNEVKAWVQSKGINPESHQYVFTNGF